MAPLEHGKKRDNYHGDVTHGQHIVQFSVAYFGFSYVIFVPSPKPRYTCFPRYLLLPETSFGTDKPSIGISKSGGGKALHGLISKRKQMLEDVSLLKKLKINETESAICNISPFLQRHGSQVVPIGFGLDIFA
ncbi:hypothetical protein SO802_007574 [Lithocarpus litseifolius]|uniref:Uncharacterized protein n=1 Tax=Lithocarpus litseifolius TaxID=425828 RepID=A0AAW2DU09_9ROSI